MQTCITSGGCMSLGPNNGLSWATITLPGSLPQTPSGSPCSGTARSQHSTRSSAPSPSKFFHSESLRGPEGLHRPHLCGLASGTSLPITALRPWPRHTFLYIPASSLPSALPGPLCLTSYFKSKPLPTLTLFYLFS